MIVILADFLMHFQLKKTLAFALQYFKALIYVIVGLTLNGVDYKLLITACASTAQQKVWEFEW